jgi:uncharacterized protein
MKKMGFLLDNEDDEKAILKKEYEKSAGNHLKKHIFITTTDRCNLGCHYCFEEKNQWIKMSNETQQALIEYSTKFLTQTPTESLGVTWYGGEPTMNMPAIINLATFYNKFCKENNIFLYQDIITNGTTLTSHICEVLLNLGVRKAQVTVDGIKEHHDVSRPYLKDLTIEQMSPAQKSQVKKINPSLLLNVINNDNKQQNLVTRSSFDQIVKGIETYVEKGGEVSLRMNVNSENIDKTTELLDDLYKKNLFHKNENGGFLYAYAQPVYDIGPCGNSSGCNSCPVSSMKMSVFSKKIESIKDWYKSKNTEFDHAHEMYFTGQTCTANRKYEIVVNPDGTITKCTHDVGIPEKVVASVFDEDTSPDKRRMPDTAYDRFNPFNDNECSSCEVLPICLGGCKSNNKVGTALKYEAGCASVRYTYDSDIIRLYEKNKNI